MSGLKAGMVLIVVVVLVYLVGGPYWAAYQIKEAAESRDGEKLSGYVEFVPLRQSIKDQLNAMLLDGLGEQDNQTLAGIGASIGLAFGGVVVDKMVDAYVTPAGLTQIMQGETLENDRSGQRTESESESDAREPFKDADFSYESFSKFSITVPNENGEGQTKFILRRVGLGWKLTEVLLPL